MWQIEELYRFQKASAFIVSESVGSPESLDRSAAWAFVESNREEVKQRRDLVWFGRLGWHLSGKPRVHQPQQPPGWGHLSGRIVTLTPGKNTVIGLPVVPSASAARTCVAISDRYVSSFGTSV